VKAGQKLIAHTGRTKYDGAAKGAAPFSELQMREPAAGVRAPAADA